MKDRIGMFVLRCGVVLVVILAALALFAIVGLVFGVGR